MESESDPLVKLRDKMIEDQVRINFNRIEIWNRICQSWTPKSQPTLHKIQKLHLGLQKTNSRPRINKPSLLQIKSPNLQSTTIKSNPATNKSHPSSLLLPTQTLPCLPLPVPSQLKSWRWTNKSCKASKKKPKRSTATCSKTLFTVGSPSLTKLRRTLKRRLRKFISHPQLRNQLACPDRSVGMGGRIWYPKRWWDWSNFYSSAQPSVKINSSQADSRKSPNMSR